MRGIVLMILLALFSCAQPQEPSIMNVVDSTTLNDYVLRIDSLQQVIKGYEYVDLSDRQEGLVTTDTTGSLLEDLKKAASYLSSPTGKHFIFFTIVLATPDNNTGSREKTFVSEIVELTRFDEEIEYKLLDDFQESIRVRYENGEKVVSRKTHIYYTYREASKQRNELLY